MHDVNFPLRRAYFSLLSGITFESVAVPCYYQKAPDGISANNYIVFGGINNNDTSSKYKAETSTSIRVVIHTYKSKFNNGAACDAIAGLVFDVIYPNRQVNHDLSGDNLQVVSTELSGDYTQPYTIANDREYIDRHLVFTHIIFHQ